MPLHQQRSAFVRLVDAGYADAWSAEVDGADAFTPLALAAEWAPRLRLGTAIVPAFTRSPALISQSAAAIADAAPGRFILGIGASSQTLVESWNGIAYQAPYDRTRDVLRFVRDALTGARMSCSYDSFTIDGFRLQRVPEITPPILVAGLRPRMLRLGAEEGDGVILNWVSPTDVARITTLVTSGQTDRKEIVARLFVVPTDDVHVVRATARRLVTAYLNVPAYAAAQRWHGHADALEPMWQAWARGDRRQALELVPDSVIDDLFVHGSVEACQQRIGEYAASGLTASSLSILGVPPDDAVSALEALSADGS